MTVNHEMMTTLRVDLTVKGAENCVKFLAMLACVSLTKQYDIRFTYLLLDINVPVVTCHASKQSSKMAMDGDYTPSRLNALMYQRLVARNTYVR